MRLPQTPPKKGRIEIIPMIDAIFFLLVFFMFSSLSMVKMSGMNVTLPQAPGGAPSTAAVSPKPGVPEGAAARKVMVAVSQEGMVSVDGTPLNPGNIPTMIQLRLEGKGAKLVIVQPAKTGTMQQLISLMDALNEVTLTDGSRPTVLIATEPVDDPKE